MMTSALCNTAPRTQILAIIDNDVLAQSLRSALTGTANICIVATPGDALVRIARGHQFELVLCNLPVAAALALHAAIAQRDPYSAGRVLVFDVSELSAVVRTATEIAGF